MSVMAAKIAPYDTNDNLDAFSERVKEINEAEKPDVTIVLCHAMPVGVAEALDPEDVDLVCGGDVHAGICCVVESGIPYIQADACAKGYVSATVTHRVTTSDYNATLAGSVFLGKTPVFPEVEAPVDNLTIIELIRAEAKPTAASFQWIRIRVNSV